MNENKSAGRIGQFLARKNIIFSGKRYGIDALGAMAQGLFASLLIGTIVSTLGQQLGMEFLITVGNYTKSTYVVGAAMAISIGYALQAPQLVLFSLVSVGAAANELGAAGGPLAVLIITVLAAECGKAISKETRIDILLSLVGASHRNCSRPHRRSDHVGNRAAALLHGNSGICYRWNCPDASHLQRRHLRCSGSCRSRRRSGGRRMLCPDGGLRRHELPGKQMGRTHLTGSRHQHAADGKYRKKSTYLDPSYTGIRHHRTSRHLHLPFSDERSCHFLRYGYLRSGGTDRRLYRMAERRGGGHKDCRHCHGLDFHDPYLLPPSRGPQRCFL